MYTDVRKRIYAQQKRMGGLREKVTKIQAKVRICIAALVVILQQQLKILCYDLMKWLIAFVFSVHSIVIIFVIFVLTQ